MSDPNNLSSASADSDAPLTVASVDLGLTVEVRPHPRFERPLEVAVRQAALLTAAPWVRSPGRLDLDVTTQGWRFPTPPDMQARPRPEPVSRERPTPREAEAIPAGRDGRPERTRLRPSPETV